MDGWMISGGKTWPRGSTLGCFWALGACLPAFIFIEEASCRRSASCFIVAGSRRKQNATAWFPCGDKKNARFQKRRTAQGQLAPEPLLSA